MRRKKITSRKKEKCHITVLVEGNEEFMEDVAHFTRRMKRYFRHSLGKEMSYKIISC